MKVSYKAKYKSFLDIYLVSNTVSIIPLSYLITTILKNTSYQKKNTSNLFIIKCNNVNTSWKFFKSKEKSFLDHNIHN